MPISGYHHLMLLPPAPILDLFPAISLYNCNNNVIGPNARLLNELRPHQHRRHAPLRLQSPLRRRRHRVLGPRRSSPWRLELDDLSVQGMFAILLDV